MKFEPSLCCRTCGCHKDWHEDGNGNFTECRYYDLIIGTVHGNGFKGKCLEYLPKDNLEYLEYKYEQRLKIKA
jgi:hypothetical protein